MSASVAGTAGLSSYTQPGFFPPDRRRNDRDANPPPRKSKAEHQSAVYASGPSGMIEDAPQSCRSENPSEPEMIQRAVAGDDEALEILFSRHRMRLYRVALRLLRSKEDAEDAVQDALLSAYRNLAAFQGRSLFSTWLTRIVVNAALIKRRSQKSRPELFLEDAGSNLARPTSIDVIDLRPDPEQILASAESHSIVEEALNKLAPAMRSAFRLRELQDLSNSEAARASGVQMGAFKSRITRARNQLATQLDHSTLVPLQKFIPSLSASPRMFGTEDSH